MKVLQTQQVSLRKSYLWIIVDDSFCLYVSLLGFHLANLPVQFQITSTHFTKIIVGSFYYSPKNILIFCGTIPKFSQITITIFDYLLKMGG